MGFYQPFYSILFLLYALKESIISCVGMVDRSRYLIGDANGRLLMLFVDSEEKIDGVTQVSSMKLEVLGEVSVPELSGV